jgi:hypothetical protein
MSQRVPVATTTRGFDHRFDAALVYDTPEEQDMYMIAYTATWAVKNWIWADTSGCPERGFALLNHVQQIGRHDLVQQLYNQAYAGTTASAPI